MRFGYFSAWVSFGPGEGIEISDFGLAFLSSLRMAENDTPGQIPVGKVRYLFIAYNVGISSQ
jgi:hypothetical protein